MSIGMMILIYGWKNCLCKGVDNRYVVMIVLSSIVGQFDEDKKGLQKLEICC
jgi:hypothetical protein